MGVLGLISIIMNMYAFAIFYTFKNKFTISVNKPGEEEEVREDLC